MSDAPQPAVYAPDSPAAHYWYARFHTHPWPILVAGSLGLGVLIGLVIGVTP